MSNNQEPLEFAIISFIFMTFLFDSGVILKEEIRCLSLKGLINTIIQDDLVLSAELIIQDILANNESF